MASLHEILHDLIDAAAMGPHKREELHDQVSALAAADRGELPEPLLCNQSPKGSVWPVCSLPEHGDDVDHDSADFTWKTGETIPTPKTAATLNAAGDVSRETSDPADVVATAQANQIVQQSPAPPLA